MDTDIISVLIQINFGGGHGAAINTFTHTTDSSLKANTNFLVVV